MMALETTTKGADMTRKIDEMTHEEIVALTNEDIDRLIKIAMAEAGIPILDEPEMPKAPSLPKEDMQVFTASCLGQLGFLNKDECQEVLDAIVRATSRVRFDHDYSLGCNKVYPGFSTDYSDGEGHADIKAVSGRSLSQLRYVRTSLEDKKKAEKDYTAAVAAHRQANADAADIRREILDIHSRHLAIDYRRSYLQKKFQQYLDLAEGSAEIALRFLAKVETLSEDERAILLGDPLPTQATEED
jgi:hypothetical protein